MSRINFLLSAVEYEKSFITARPVVSSSQCHGLVCACGISWLYSLVIVFYLLIYNIPINDTSFELSVFRLSDTESRINELRFSDSISQSFKTRLMSIICFCGYFT